MEIVIVERSFEQLTPEEAQAMEHAVAWCLEAHGVTFKYSYWARDNTLAVCVYEAPDAESVRRVQRQSGIPYDRIWTARRVAP